MGKTVKKQARFAVMIALLILYAYIKGYYLTFGDAYRGDKKGHKKKSLHYIRLAVDFNLFINGKYQKESEAHRPLGLFWEFLGGTWGGRWGDGNHYSLEHQGRK